MRIKPFGPVYVAHETVEHRYNPFLGADYMVPVLPGEKEILGFDFAWMAETEPPYRKGKALRFRWGTKHAFHLGLCRKYPEKVTARVLSHDEVDLDTIREASWSSDSSGPPSP